MSMIALDTPERDGSALLAWAWSSILSVERSAGNVTPMGLLTVDEQTVLYGLFGQVLYSCGCTAQPDCQYSGHVGSGIWRRDMRRRRLCRRTAAAIGTKCSVSMAGFASVWGQGKTYKPCCRRPSWSTPATDMQGGNHGECFGRRKR